MASCTTIERFTQDPNYRVVYLDEVPEEEVPEEEVPVEDILYPLSANVKIV